MEGINRYRPFAGYACRPVGRYRRLTAAFGTAAN